MHSKALNKYVYDLRKTVIFVNLSWYSGSNNHTALYFCRNLN